MAGGSVVLSLWPIFMIGVLGSVHCVGMCGGIVSALTIATPAAPPRRRFPVAVVTRGGAMAAGASFDSALRVVSYNAGRIGSYTIAGALAGGLAGGARALAGMSALQMGGYWLANLMLVALGLYLMDAWRGLAYLENAGQAVWRRIQPLMRHLLPLDSAWKLLAAGGLWGWLPCGMVYSVLLTALVSGSALSGAGVMLAFGLGTLPTLLMMGLLGARLKSWLQRRPVRLACGLMVLGFGMLGLLRATHGVPTGWMDGFCFGGVPS